MSAALSREEKTRPSVLLLEDDPAVRRSLQLLLLSQGYDVRSYGSCALALADPHARDSDCLVADLVMPEFSGIEFLKRLRAAGWKKPSILISGVLDELSAAKATKAGYDAILRKPIEHSVIITTLKDLLERPRASQRQ